MGVSNMATAADVTPPSQASGHERMLACHALISALVREFPTDLQTEAIHLAEDIHQHLWGWRRDGRTTEERQQTSERMDCFEAELSRHLPRVDVEWHPEAAWLEPPASTIPVANRVPRPLLVALTNRTAKPITVSVQSSGTVSCRMSPQPVPVDGTRLFLLSLCLPEPAARSDIALSAEGGAPRLVSLALAFAESATVQGVLEEGPTGRLWPGRVWVRGSDGVYRHDQALAENTTLSEKPVIFRPLWHRLPFFYSRGRFVVQVPPGSVQCTLERGFEHELVSQASEIRPGATAQVVLRSSRFLDMRALGWISGDTHVHWAKNSWDENEDLGLLALVQRAEDLRVVNNLTLYQHRPEAAGGPFLKPDQQPMGPVPGHCDDGYHLQMAEEYRNDRFYGHINLLGISQLIAPVATGPGSGGDDTALDWPHNRQAIDACHRQGGIVAEAHGFGPCENGDAAVNAVLGLADLMDQLDPRWYYLLLNAAVRVPLGNGSDHPARVAGSARMYSKIAGPFSYAAWLDGIRAGRTFVTSGPLLFLSVNGQEIGSRLEVAPGTVLTLAVRALSRHPIGRLQIVSNGSVLEEMSTQEHEATLRRDLKADVPRWFVARCGPGEEFAAICTAEDEYRARPDVAHTSATYVDIGGRPAFAAAAARELVARFQVHAEDIAQRGCFAEDGQRRHAVAHVEAAVRVLEERLERLAPTGE
jgi:hypothetical protein